MKTALDFWIESEEGKGCNTPLTEPQQPYLNNRLYRAYNAGLRRSGEDKQIEEMRKLWLDQKGELMEAKKLIKKLTKYKRK